MPSPQIPFILTPHPTTPSAVRSIGGWVSRVPGGLMVRYAFKGDIDCIRVPARQRRGVADNLWHHTCCEAFLARKGEPGYVEFNFAPSGEWAVYAFGHPRERTPLAVPAADLDPHIAMCRNDTKLELDAVLPLDRLSPQYAGATLVLGLATVVEDQQRVLSYWALNHPRDRPDFHHPDAFALELDEVRH